MLSERPAKATAERGSALLLMPVGVLIFIILGAITVDVAVIFLAERELANAAAAAANDAATRGIDLGQFYDSSGAEAPPTAEAGEPQVDQDLATAFVADTIADRQFDSVEGVRPVTTASGATVRVELTGSVPSIFAGALAGGWDTFDVGASAEATARRN